MLVLDTVHVATASPKIRPDYKKNINYEPSFIHETLTRYVFSRSTVPLRILTRHVYTRPHTDHDMCVITTKECVVAYLKSLSLVSTISVSLSLSVCLYLSVCLSVVCLSVGLSVRRSVCLPVCPSVCLSASHPTDTLTLN